MIASCACLTGAAYVCIARVSLAAAAPVSVLAAAAQTSAPQYGQVWRGVDGSTSTAPPHVEQCTVCAFIAYPAEGVPQFEQNFPATWVPHSLQNFGFAIGVPHSEQNLPSGTVALHAVH